MTKKIPPGITRYTDRHGKLRWRFRKRGLPESQTRALFDAPEWWRWYAAVSEGQSAPVGAGSERTKPGSISALIVSYYGSTDFTTLSASTQVTYRGIIERFRQDYGDLQVSTLKAHNIRKVLDAKANTPAAANNLFRMLKILMRHAVDRGWREDDPTLVVRKIRNRSDGFHTWTEEEIAAFEARHPLGTRARLALALLLYTAQRRSDVVRMGRQHVREGAIDVQQQKTKTRLSIPIHSRLQGVLDSVPADNLTFLVTKHGKPFTPAGFTNWFRECVKEAGLSDLCSPHGLRKAAARRLAEAGCSPHEIMSITGHKGLREVDRYTIAANRDQLARTAIGSISKDGK